MFLFGFFLGFGSFGIFGAVKFVHSANDDENREGDNEKVNDVLEEIAISNVSNGVGTEDVRNVNRKGRKI